MRVYFLLLILFIFTFSFALDLEDVSRNYKNRDTVYYLAENNMVPPFIDKTFQLNSGLTVYQTAVSLLFSSGVSLSYKQKQPYMAEYNQDSIVYPYIQYIYEKKLVTSETDGYVICSVSEAVSMFSKVYKDVEFVVEGKEASSSITREDFTELLLKVQSFKQKVMKYKMDKRKREEEYVGSAVSEYILGYTNALDKIELSKYSSGNKDYYDIFWLFASETDLQYQKFNEDLSNESLDILEKRLNQALLNFYKAKYWLVISQCNIILRENPQHIGALNLKGSTYYMLRDFVKARKYWEKVLYYEPTNKEVGYFLKVLPVEVEVL